MTAGKLILSSYDIIQLDTIRVFLKNIFIRFYFYILFLRKIFSNSVFVFCFFKMSILLLYYDLAISLCQVKQLKFFNEN